VLGGHAVLAVGYDDASQRFIVSNSWGSGWGMKGYFTIPYSYLTDNNLADDFWTIGMVVLFSLPPSSPPISSPRLVRPSPPPFGNGGEPCATKAGYRHAAL
jgi:hypothetical protein